MSQGYAIKLTTGEYLDLVPDKAITLTNFNAFFSNSGFPRSYTLDFTIPPSPHNVKLLGYSDRLDADNCIEVGAQFLVGGVPLHEGVLKVVGDGIKVRFVTDEDLLLEKAKATNLQALSIGKLQPTTDTVSTQATQIRVALYQGRPTPLYWSYFGTTLKWRLVFDYASTPKTYGLRIDGQLFTRTLTEILPPAINGTAPSTIVNLNTELINPIQQDIINAGINNVTWGQTSYTGTFNYDPHPLSHSIPIITINIGLGPKRKVELFVQDDSNTALFFIPNNDAPPNTYKSSANRTPNDAELAVNTTGAYSRLFALSPTEALAQGLDCITAPLLQAPNYYDWQGYSGVINEIDNYAPQPPRLKAGDLQDEYLFQVELGCTLKSFFEGCDLTLKGALLELFNKMHVFSPNSMAEQAPQQCFQEINGSPAPSTMQQVGGIPRVTNFYTSTFSTIADVAQALPDVSVAELLQQLSCLFPFFLQKDTAKNCWKVVSKATQLAAADKDITAKLVGAVSRSYDCEDGYGTLKFTGSEKDTQNADESADYIISDASDCYECEAMPLLFGDTVRGAKNDVKDEVLIYYKERPDNFDSQTPELAFAGEFGLYETQLKELIALSKKPQEYTASFDFGIKELLEIQQGSVARIKVSTRRGDAKGIWKKSSTKLYPDRIGETKVNWIKG